MKRLNILAPVFLLFFLFNACGQSEANTKVNEQAAEQAPTEPADKKAKTTSVKSDYVGNIPVHDFKSFEPLLYLNNDTTYVVNFWATWCKPCVAELPYFEKLQEEYKDKKVKVLLVSLDFSTQIEKKLVPFMEKRKLKSEVIVLDDPDANGWIDKVNPKWSGAIPATVIYQGKKRGFFEQSFENYEDLVAVMKGIK